MSLSGFISLGEISDSIMGQAPPGEDCNKDGVGTPFVKAGEFDIQRPIIREWTTKPQKFAKSTDVLLCVVGATCGKINLGIDCAIGRSVAAIRPDPKKLDQMFLYYFLLSWTERLRAMSQGAAQTVINKEMIANLKIPNLSLAEQRRIAAILDKADAIRRKRQQAIKLADDFLRSVFLEMFGDPVTNPKGWEVKELCELIADGDRINYGIVQPGDYVESGIPVVRVGDFESGKINPLNLKRVSREIDMKHKHSRLVGDEILIACVGATAGKVALADETLKGFNTVRAVTRIRVNHKVNRHYVFRYLQSPYVQSYIQRQLRTVGQPTLNGKQISQIPILIPDQLSQDRYLSIAEKTLLIIDQLHYGSARFVEQFNSVSQKAFSGRL